MTTIAKASNALVTIVDFYSGLIADLHAQLQAKDVVIQKLGEQLKRVSQPDELVECREDACGIVSGAKVKALEDAGMTIVRKKVPDVGK